MSLVTVPDESWVAMRAQNVGPSAIAGTVAEVVWIGPVEKTSLAPCEVPIDRLYERAPVVVVQVNDLPVLTVVNPLVGYVIVEPLVAAVAAPALGTMAVVASMART